MPYTLAYSMITGRGHRQVQTAKMAIETHRDLMLAGAGAIIIRDEHNLVVTLANLVSLCPEKIGS